jgi:hypothetical protein
MGGTRYGILGTDNPPPQTLSGGDIDVLGDGDAPGSLGIDEPETPNLGGPPAIPLDTTGRKIAKVTKDWDPPNPRHTPPIVVQGATLEAAGNALNRLREWGDGGGELRTDKIGKGNTTDLTVVMHANLVHRLPTWANYAKASPAAKAEWDRMVAKLKIHEDRHLEIAIEEANKLAAELIGKDIGDIADMVTEANRRMAQRQQDMDDACDHGAKENVPYGDVILDISIK